MNVSRYFRTIKKKQETQSTEKRERTCRVVGTRGPRDAWALMPYPLALFVDSVSFSSLSLDFFLHPSFSSVYCEWPFICTDASGAQRNH